MLKPTCYLTWILRGLTHKSDNMDIQFSFQNSKQLEQIKIPTVEQSDDSQELDIHCRFFSYNISTSGKLVVKMGWWKTLCCNTICRWSYQLVTNFT